MPFTMSGVDSSWNSGRGPRLSVLKRQAISRLLKLEAVIWSRGEYRLLALSPPYTGHSPVLSPTPGADWLVTATAVQESSDETTANPRRRTITGNDLIVVRAGTRHNIRNTASSDLKLVTIYAPPAHAEGTIHRTREDAVGAMIRSERAYS